MIMTKAHAGVGLLAAAALASAGEALSASIEQAPAATFQALENIEANRAALDADRYREAVTAFGDASFQSWHERHVEPLAGAEAFYADTKKTATTDATDSLEASQSIIGAHYTLGGNNAGRWAAGLIWADQTLSGGELSGSGDLIQGYGRYASNRGERGVIDATLAYTFVDQSISAPSQSDSEAIDAQVVELGLGAKTHFGAQGWLMRPSTDLTYRYVDQDSFEERTEESIDSETFGQLDWSVGVELSYPFILKRLGNSVLTPYVSGAYHVDIIEPKMDFGVGGESENDPAFEKTRYAAGLDWQFTPQLNARVSHQDAASEQISAAFQWRF